jgi:hypothetical protein
MNNQIVVIESTVEIPDLGWFLRREYLTPDGDSIQVEYLAMADATVAA